MEDKYKNKYDDQSVVPDSLKVVACFLFTASIVVAYLFSPTYERGQEREIVHFSLSIFTILSGIFMASVLFGMSFICQRLDTKK